MRLAMTLALMSGAVAAGAEGAEQSEQELPEISRHTTQISSFTLKNGLDVIVLEDHRAPVVVNMLWYRAGAADEEPGVSGIAHFLEHLMFKSTDTLESGEFSRTVEANGGSDNAFTSSDYTGYFQRVAADRLGLMMQMEADRMTGLRLSEEDVRTEREVILEERNQRVDNDPGALFSEQTTAALYQNHPYGVPLIGWRHEMEQLSRADAMAFYKEHYAPNNAFAIVAGDVTPEQVRALAVQHYGPLAAKPDLAPRIRPQEPPHRAARRVIYEDARVAQPYVSRAYLAPERDPGEQREAAALMLAARLLGSGQTSFMVQKLQFEQKIAVASSAYYRGISYDDTRFVTYVVPAQGVSLEQAEAAMDEALALFLQEPIDPEHLERIKMRERAAEIYGRDDVQSLANYYGGALSAGLTVQDILEWPEIVQSITAEEIKSALRDVLDRRASVTGWLRAPVSPEQGE